MISVAALLILPTIIELFGCKTFANPVISSAGMDYTNALYILEVGEDVSFSCGGSPNISYIWMQSTIAGYIDIPATSHLQQRTEGNYQILVIANFIQTLAIKFHCRESFANLTSFVQLRKDILQRVTVLSSESVEVAWEDPNVVTTSLNIKYCINSSSQCQTITANTAYRKHEIVELQKFTTYHILIEDFSKGITVKTLEDSPSGFPQAVTVQIRQNGITFEWEIPQASERNGIIVYYLIRYLMASGTTTLYNHSIADTATFSEPNKLSRTFANVEEGSMLGIQMAAGTSRGPGPYSAMLNFTVEFVSISVSHQTDTSVLVTWTIPTTVLPLANVTKVSLFYGLFEDSNKQIQLHTKTLSSTIDNLDIGKPYSVRIEISLGLVRTTSLDKVIFSKEQEPKIAPTGLTFTRLNKSHVELSWTALSLYEARGFPIYTVFVRASEQTGWERELKTEPASSTFIIVGVLEEGIEYEVQVRVTTAASDSTGLASDIVTIPPFGGASDKPKSENVVEGVAVGAGVGGSVLLAVIVTVCVLVVLIIILFNRFKNKRHINSKSNSGNVKNGTHVAYESIKSSELEMESTYAHLSIESDTDSVKLSEILVMELNAPANTSRSYENTRPPLSLSDFPKYVNRMKQDKSYRVEFNSLPYFDPTAEVRVGESPSNMKKNRYKGILPLDKARVKLPESDYINAAFLDGYKGSHKYIATQGPLEETVQDFWLMVWENRVSVIVMLTKLVEMGKKKCEIYWSDKPISFTNGITVELQENKIYSNYVSRTFVVTKTDNSECLRVHQLQYTAWPDHGVPKYPEWLIHFVEVVRHLYRDLSHPLLVHCSAGVGRTGTFLTIDTMIQRIKDRKDINIYKYVYEMRCSRTGMVNNADQYLFIHEAIQDYIESLGKVIRASELKEAVVKLAGNNENSTLYEKEFEQLANIATAPTKDDETFAEGKVLSRRYSKRYPYKSNCISVTGDAEMKYFNASCINGIASGRSFIAGEAPLQDSIDSVLQIISIHRCTVVVLFATHEELSDVTFGKFWPQGDEKEVRFGVFTVSLSASQEKTEYKMLKLRISSDVDVCDHEFTLLICSCWSETSDTSPSALLSLLNECESVQCEGDAPMLVMCNDGTGRTGTFICLFKEVLRMSQYDYVNIYQSVKELRNQRPYMVSTLEQYISIHTLLLDYWKRMK